MHVDAACVFLELLLFVVFTIVMQECRMRGGTHTHHTHTHTNIRDIFLCIADKDNVSKKPFLHSCMTGFSSFLR